MADNENAPVYITVTGGEKLTDGQIAILEHDELHPPSEADDGEHIARIIKGDKIFGTGQVGPTARVYQGLERKTLVQVEDARPVVEDPFTRALSARGNAGTPDARFDFSTTTTTTTTTAPDDLDTLTREELNALATDLGIENASSTTAFPTKSALVAAIRVEQAGGGAIVP